MFFFSVKLLFL